MSLKFYILLLFALCNHSIFAKHIIGGDISYVCNGINKTTNRANYTITIKVYRDCNGNGAKFDENPYIGIYLKSANNNYTVFQSVQ
ncbi:MAG: hypothetical protein IPQ02_11875 [Saprospiraceae bacterium]|nr:hypothetical protein [Candidatus Defluviibacterium haderslevense]